MNILATHVVAGVVTVVGIVGLTIIGVHALNNGIDHVVIAGVAAAIATAIGVAVPWSPFVRRKSN